MKFLVIQRSTFQYSFPTEGSKKYFSPSILVSLKISLEAVILTFYESTGAQLGETSVIIGLVIFIVIFIVSLSLFAKDQ